MCPSDAPTHCTDSQEAVGTLRVTERQETRSEQQLRGVELTDEGFAAVTALKGDVSNRSVRHSHRHERGHAHRHTHTRAHAHTRATERTLNTAL